MVDVSGVLYRSNDAGEDEQSRVLHPKSGRKRERVNCAYPPAVLPTARDLALSAHTCPPPRELDFILKADARKFVRGLYAREVNIRRAVWKVSSERR